jgi:hypothetical protein
VSIDKELAALANWSPWLPFAEVASAAPRQPGVYLARQEREIIYVGMAGLRNRGGLTAVKGLQGRLSHYARGKALATGLGEAVFTRAITDPEWLRTRLSEVEAGEPGTLRDWGRAAFARADLEICWATTEGRDSALALERQVMATLRKGVLLWNQRL